MWSTKRLARAALAAALVGLGVGSAYAHGAFGPPGPTTAERAAQAAAAAKRQALTEQARVVHSAASSVAAHLPSAAGEAAPASGPGDPLFAAPLGAHAVYGFVPYWEVAALTPADYADSSVLAYFGLDVSGTGALVRSGYGWDSLAAPSFTTFVADAHAAGDRVLLTVSTTDPAVVSGLTTDPAAASERLAAELLPLVAADHLDGVDLDIEGRATSGRAGFVTFVTDLAKSLRAGDPEGQLVLDTYPQSAGSSSDFFDVAKLAPLVDTIFVMAYDMNDPSAASASSPLASPVLGLSDVGALLAYTKVVPPAKLVLGLPLYGNDYPTAGRAPGAASLADTPTAVTYAAIAATGRSALWDPGSLTPYEVFRLDGTWHQTWFDDPVSLALKAALADTFALGGVGAWALGQEGDAPDVLEALDGGTAPLKLALSGSSG